jgi:lipopolysaccharide transport protein LptA
MHKQAISMRSQVVAMSVVLLGAQTFALESDRSQDVRWSADGNSSMMMKDGLRILELSDNVEVTQGSLFIQGDEAVFEYDATTNELNRVTVQGSPVRYQQQLDEDGGMVVGTSETLSFYTDEIDGETIVELQGNANIESPDSTMKCSTITYLADQDLIREAAGPCEGLLNSTNN